MTSEEIRISPLKMRQAQFHRAVRHMGHVKRGLIDFFLRPKRTLSLHFPVEMDDQIMLATSKGQSIRVPVDGISFRSRSAGGVKVFNTGKGEEVVSVAWIADQGDDEANEA